MKCIEDLSMFDWIVILLHTCTFFFIFYANFLCKLLQIIKSNYSVIKMY